MASVDRRISSLTTLYYDHGPRLQLFIFSRIPYLYKAPENA
ncbi:hypothetical protein [Agrobacterium fabrum]|nr:hypothetical protein [Agrobacterium fabrum]MDH6297831.1 hypothetical protein [Agrobacterium fabrum]